MAGFPDGREGTLTAHLISRCQPIPIGSQGGCISNRGRLLRTSGPQNPLTSLLAEQLPVLRRLERHRTLPDAAVAQRLGRRLEHRLGL